jgi:hypothetical protein
MKTTRSVLLAAAVSLSFAVMGLVAAPLLPGAQGELSARRWHTVTTRPCEQGTPPCPYFCKYVPCCPCGVQEE